MQLDWTDTRLKCKLDYPNPDTARLIISFPAEPEYLKKVVAVIGELVQLRFGGETQKSKAFEDNPVAA